MLLSTAYYILQLVVTVMGIFIGFAITFTTGSYLSRGEKIREAIIKMWELFGGTKEEMQAHAKDIYDEQITHLKKERNLWFSGLGIIAFLIFQSLLWDIYGFSLLLEINFLISTILGIGWTFGYTYRTIDSIIKHFKGYGKDLGVIVKK